MPVKIKGSEYSTVAERLNSVHNDHDYISITTDIVDETQEYITIKANVSIHNDNFEQKLAFIMITLNKYILVTRESISSSETETPSTSLLPLKMLKHQLLAELWLVLVTAGKSSLLLKKCHGSKPKPRHVKAKSLIVAPLY